MNVNKYLDVFFFLLQFLTCFFFFCLFFQSRHYSSEEDLGDIDFDSSPYILTPRNRTEDNHRRQEARAKARERLDFNNPSETAQRRLHNKEDERKEAEGKKYQPSNTPSSRSGKENKVFEVRAGPPSSADKRDRGDGRDIELIRQSKNVAYDTQINKTSGENQTSHKSRREMFGKETEFQVYSVSKAEAGSQSSRKSESPTKPSSVKRRPHIYIKSNNHPHSGNTKDITTPVKNKVGSSGGQTIRTPIPQHSTDQSARTAAAFRPSQSSRTPGRRDQFQTALQSASQTKGKSVRQQPGAAVTPSLHKPSPATGRKAGGDKFVVPLTPISRATPAKFRLQSPMVPKQPAVTSMDDSCELSFFLVPQVRHLQNFCRLDFPITILG